MKTTCTKKQEHLWQEFVRTSYNDWEIIVEIDICMNCMVIRRVEHTKIYLPKGGFDWKTKVTGYRKLGKL